MNVEKFEYCYWPRVISEDQIKEINSICEKYHEPESYDEPAENSVKKVNVKTITWKYLKPILFDVMEIWVNKNKEIFGYSLFPIQNMGFLNIK